ELKQAYRLHTLHAGLREGEIQQVVSRLRAAGVEPLLLKGWAVARLYPEPGLRPYGDLGLCVRPEQMPAAEMVLAEAAGLCGAVDLHQGVPELADRNLDELNHRSRLARLGEVEVPILGSEDQLRHLCLHLMRHGAWRPLWLCDIGAALESLPADFDLDYCLSGSPRLTAWVVCAIGLVGQLLGARIPSAADAAGASRLPRWLVPAVPPAWGSPKSGDSHTRDDKPMAAYLREPAGLLHGLRCRWPNAIEATFKMHARPNSLLPKRLLQFGMWTGRAIEFARKLPGTTGNGP